MGYACPVCETPQQDAEHLANHLAFTALLRDDGHADWLDERVPDWGECGPADLVARVVDHVDETAYDAVFEDTVDDRGGDAFGQQSARDHDHPGHAHDHPGVGDPDLAGYAASGGDLDPETREVLAEAREMTRQMRGEASESGGGGDAGEERGATDGTGEESGSSDVAGEENGSSDVAGEESGSSDVAGEESGSADEV